MYSICLRKKPPRNPPTLHELVLLVASLGDYIEMKNFPPGLQSIWIGLQRAYDLAIAWRSFGPGATMH